MSVGSECLNKFVIKCLWELVQPWSQTAGVAPSRGQPCRHIGFVAPRRDLMTAAPEARQHVGSAAMAQAPERHDRHQRKKPRRSGAVVLGMAKPNQRRAASTR